MVVRQEWDYSCGAAALATILKYQYSYEINEAKVVEGLLKRTSLEEVMRRHGFSLLDLKRFAQDLGFEAVGYGDLEISDLLPLAPAIVPIRRGNGNHFIVVRGRRGNMVLVGDPELGTRLMEDAQFERDWLHVALVIARHGGPSSNRLSALPSDFAGIPVVKP